jgi:hypothetical protein
LFLFLTSEKIFLELAKKKSNIFIVLSPLWQKLYLKKKTE